jgi:predicted nucleic acid-binding protein
VPGDPDSSVTALDTSVIVAGLLSWHRDHEPARSAIDGLLTDGDVVVPAHALLEAYSVMTRLPAPHRIAPSDASALLMEAFEESAKPAQMAAVQIFDLIRSLAADDVAGGAVYDAAILEAARRAGATRILTLNPGDFERFASGGIEVSNPIEWQ